MGYSQTKHILDVHNEMRRKCKNEKNKEDILDKYKNDPDYMTDAVWDWELYDYAYFNTLIQGQYCEHAHTPEFEKLIDAKENWNAGVQHEDDWRNNPGAEKFFIEGSIDAYSQEGHEYYKHSSEVPAWKKPNHYTVYLSD